ncbi:PREDICTED: polyamine oxidase 1-like, partial [Wasmannia auropunctata]|uniref:polyamine oxidase 1-like n=1 Tax=Wasmannia auropunctata TaxID=64793 RepID=UPI0005EEEB83
EAKVVIVGAGSAVIAAASRLSQNGMNDFVILEANDRIGGRIYTKDFGKNVVDLGAQWVLGKSNGKPLKAKNVVYDLASKHGLLSPVNQFDKREFVTINGIIPAKESSEAMLIHSNILDNIKKIDFKGEKNTYGDYLIQE